MRQEFKDAIRKGQFEKTDEGELYLPRQSVLVGGFFGSEVWRNGECIAPYEEAHNVVVNEGLDHVLNVVLAEGAAKVSPAAAWYIAMYKQNSDGQPTWTGATFPSAALEVPTADYNAGSGARQLYDVDGASSTQSLTNTSTKATFTAVNGPYTVYGAALLSTSPASDVTGVLFAASSFSAGRVLETNDQLLVTYTVNASDA